MPQHASHILSKPSSLIVDRRFASSQYGFAASDRCLAASLNASFCFRVLSIAFSLPRNCLIMFREFYLNWCENWFEVVQHMFDGKAHFVDRILKKRLNWFIHIIATKSRGNMQISTHTFQWFDLKFQWQTSSTRK